MDSSIVYNLLDLALANVWVMYKQVNSQKQKSFDFFLQVVEDSASIYQLFRLIKDNDQEIMKILVMKTEISLQK